MYTDTPEKSNNNSNNNNNGRYSFIGNSNREKEKIHSPGSWNMITTPSRETWTSVCQTCWLQQGGSGTQRNRAVACELGDIYRSLCPRPHRAWRLRNWRVCSPGSGLKPVGRCGEGRGRGWSVGGGDETGAREITHTTVTPAVWDERRRGTVKRRRREGESGTDREGPVRETLGEREEI